MAEPVAAVAVEVKKRAPKKRAGEDLGFVSGVVVAKKMKMSPTKDTATKGKVTAIGVNDAGMAAPIKKRQARHKKDPNRPKRAMSAYTFYMQQMHAIIRAKNPGMSMTEVTRNVGQQWTAMADADKVSYVNMAQKDKARHDAEMVNYVPPPPQLIEKGRKGGKLRFKKDPNAPKRPLTAYLIFTNEKRPALSANNSGLKLSEIAKKIGLMWGAMSDHDKLPYQNQQAVLKAKYDREKAQYDATLLPLTV